MILQFIRNKKSQLKNLAIPALFLAFVTLWLRLVYLGYSDYQGDEIKAMYRPAQGQSAFEFLMEQRKGPVQFFITAVMEGITDGYYNNFLLRLPFALAGVLSVLVFYKFVKIHFGREVAYAAAFLFSVNGFFVAFSRIVQYQSFTILFFLLALYFFSLALDNARWKYSGWYLGAVFWGLSALAHYDAVFIFPFVLYIFVQWFRKYPDTPKDKILKVTGAGLITLSIMAAFYVPFILQISGGQTDYWLGRLEDATGKISSSKYTFSIYNPIFVTKLYIAFVGIAMFKIRRLWPILVWGALPFLFMELLVDVPGTHIYTYIIPAIIAVALGIETLGKFLKNQKVFIALKTGIFMLLFLLTFTVFVDHRVEFPWSNKDFLIWTMHKPNPIFHLSIFGFPYNRQWEDVERFIEENSISGVFGTNERTSITRFYLEGFAKEGEDSEHYVLVHNPQSFTQDIYQSKPYYWVRILKKEPALVLESNGRINVKIYEMPIGNLDDLKRLERNNQL